MIAFLRTVRPAALIMFANVIAAVVMLMLMGGEDLRASVTPYPQVSPGSDRHARQADPQERFTRLMEKLERRKTARPANEAFQAPDWSPPLPVAVVIQQKKPEPPPPPVERKPEAPPLPFTYIGRMDVRGKQEVFLGQGADGISVKAGDVIGEAYRVDSITEQAVMFTHQPTGIQQVLQIPLNN